MRLIGRRRTFYLWKKPTSAVSQGLVVVDLQMRPRRVKQSAQWALGPLCIRSIASPRDICAFHASPQSQPCLGLDQQPSPLMWLVISDKWHQAGGWSRVRPEARAPMRGGLEGPGG